MDRNKMEYKGYTAQIMEAERLTGEGVHGLPQGSAIDVYYADEFKILPEQWMKGPGVFVIPVRPEKGLWFNWTGNDELNTAVIPTVKGCNPVTGMKTSGFHLETYESQCPKHGCDFKANLFCPECNYSWPDRNYCSMNPLWWDGFRSEDGSVRQFFFTEDSMRDVATALIGEQSTIPAFGFAFYAPKKKRVVDVDENSRGMSNIYFANTSYSNSGSGMTKGIASAGLDSFSLNDTIDTLGSPMKEHNSGSSMKEFNPSGLKKGFSKSLSTKSILGSRPRSVQLPQQTLKKKSLVPKETKEVSIGAGAKIRQALNKDSYPLDSWKDTPESVMTIYFVFQEKFNELKAGGMRDLSGKPEGMLNGLPVG